MSATELMEQLRQSRNELYTALCEAEQVIAKHVYPCPDKPHSPWGVLCRIRAAIAKAEGKGGEG